MNLFSKKKKGSGGTTQQTAPPSTAPSQGGTAPTGNAPTTTAPTGNAPTGNAPAPTFNITKLDVIAKNPELKAFYDTYARLPLAPTVGEGSKYKTPEDFKKLTNSAVKPPTRDMSTHLTDSDRTAVEVDKTTLGEQFLKKKAVKASQQNQTGQNPTPPPDIDGPKSELLKTVIFKVLTVVNGVAAAVTGADIKSIIVSGKGVIDGDGIGEKAMSITDTAFALTTSALNVTANVLDILSELDVISKIIPLPIVGSAISIVMSIWGWAKNAKELRQLIRRAKFLKEKQKAFKKTRFDALVVQKNIKPDRKNITAAQLGTINKNMDVDEIKKRQKEDLKLAEEKRKLDREKRKEERKVVLEKRLSAANSPKERKEIKNQMEEETKALRKMRKEGRAVIERENKQEIKNAKMALYAREHVGEHDLKRKTRMRFFNKGDGTKEEDYNINEDKVRADVFLSRGKASHTDDEKKQLEEDEEIIANFRATEVLDAKIRGQVFDIISNGLSIVGEGANIAVTATGFAVPVGTIISVLGTALNAGNAIFDGLRESLGNFHDVTQGKRYLDRSSEVNLLLRKSEETRQLDLSLKDDEKGQQTEDFSKKYWETKKYMHAYGVDMQEAVDKKNITKYHVVKYMMDAVSQV